MLFPPLFKSPALGLCLLAALGSASLRGAAADERQIFFESKIRPVLAAEC